MTERRLYESVDDRSYLRLYLKNRRKTKFVPQRDNDTILLHRITDYIF